MSPDTRSITAPITHNLWTIARICQALSPLLERRFLLDLTHAPAHEVMNVFTAWQNVAATAEKRSSADATPVATALPTPTETEQ
ncbi:hypothetical protein [Streptomyces sp. IBSBF 2435]|uniref:hypothetical protein n=1 Tax=Streptomyces sp. IBSBF 2435 TaxID=2903531 RepID=UPI002FDC4286